MMWMNKLLPKLLIFAIAIVSVCGADNSNSAAAGVSKKKAVSNHLPLLPHETLVNTVSALRVGRRLGVHKLFSKSSKKVDGKSGKANSSTKSDKANKSAKAYSKGQKGNDSALFTSCADVQAKLDTCEAAANTPSWLFVQMADMCTLYRDDDGVYYLESSNFHKDTEWFTDRPMKYEKTEATSDWFNNFNELFDDEKGMPNAALTIVDDDMSKDVVVSVFAEGYVKEGEGEDEGVTTYGYKLEQSTDQESVLALDSLIEDEEDSITFDHCSMFIDEAAACDAQPEWSDIVSLSLFDNEHVFILIV